MKIIARMKSDFPTKFGIPRQSGLVEELESLVVFEPEFREREALRGLEAFSHIWLIWEFSEAKRDNWSATVRPPRLGGNTGMGVFATRSPFRPNPIGLSCVKLIDIEHHPELGDVLRVSGADLMDGTPIYDIKPYVLYTDSRPEAVAGFAQGIDGHALKVEIDNPLFETVPESKRKALIGTLMQDPRPRYHDDPERVYGMEFAGMDVRFKVDGEVLKVVEIERIK